MSRVNDIEYNASAISSPREKNFLTSRFIMNDFHSQERNSLLKACEYQAITAFQLNEHIQEFELKYNQILQLPIEILENRLFNLTRVFLTRHDWKINRYNTIRYVHPLITAMETSDGIRSISPSIMEKIEEGDPAKEYNFVRKVVKFINDLLVNWDIINAYNYKLRFHREMKSFSCVNHKLFLSDFINMEVLWYASSLDETSLSAVTSINMKELGKLVLELFWKLFYMLLECNKEFVGNRNSIQDYLCSKNKDLAKIFGFKEHKITEKPEYQQLSITYFKWLCRKNSIKINEIKDMLSDFEYAYREFEAMFLGTLRRIYKKGNERSTRPSQ